MCSVAEVNLQRVRDGFLKEADLAAKLPKAFAELAPLPIWVDETPSLSIQDLRAKTRAFKRQRPQLAAIFVDYLQLMRSNTKRAMDNRALELAEISGGLKRIAKELNIIVFAGAQLNRDADEGNKKPRLSHLRESGSIEQDADIVILLHRPGYHQEDADQKEAVAIIAKHRNGAVCDVPLEFIGEFTRFRDADPDRTGDQRRTNASRQKQQKQKNEPAGHWDGAKPED
jgi:replicative DNA helicase